MEKVFERRSTFRIHHKVRDRAVTSLVKVTEAALRSSAISRQMKRLEDKQQHQHWFQESNYNVHNHNVQCW